MFLTFVQIGPDQLISQDFALGALSFFVIALGGIGVGMLFALLGSFITKC